MRKVFKTVVGVAGVRRLCTLLVAGSVVWAFAGVAVPSSANAALVSAGSPSCSVTDVTANAGGVNATACSGAWDGNDANQQTDVLAELANLAAGTWSYLGNTDDAGFGPFTSDPGTTSGTLTFDSAQSVTFGISLKGSNTFSLYVFTLAGPFSSVDFLTIGCCTISNGPNAGNPQNLSHAGLYTVSRNSNPNDPPDVPAPAAFSLLGIGIISLGLAARRRRRSSSI